MEVAIPLVALGGLYIVSNQNRNRENFQQQAYEGNLPNVDIPNKNYNQNSNEFNANNDLTSKLSTVNTYDGNSVYTDKYFNKDLPNTMVNTTSTQNSSAFTGETPNPQNAQYRSINGSNVGADHFQHNNMQPFFGSHIRTMRTEANSGESILDNYSGAGSQTIKKTERAPLFSPQENMQFAHGAPNMTDFFQSRVNPSLKMSNVKPFADQKVAPGIGGGYTTEGKDGFNSGLMNRNLYLAKTVDELRTQNNPKASEYGLLGHEGPADSSIKRRGDLGIQEKNRPDTFFEMGQERYFTTGGIETAPAVRGIQLDLQEKTNNRQSTTASYSGGAASHTSAQYNAEGEYMPSKHIDLGAVPVKPARRIGAGGGNEADYGMKSAVVYENNRSSNQQDTYFGAFSSAIGAAVSPLLDVVRPSRKENAIGNLRPYQNPGTTVSNSYVYNPADKPAATIRETTEVGKGHLFVDSRARSDGYLIADVNAAPTKRQTQGDFYYAGVGSAGERGRQPRTYDAEYNQRNNDVKSSTLRGYTPSGGIGLMNSNINMTTVPREITQQNRRDIVPTMPYQTASAEAMGRPTGSNQNATTYSNIQLDRTQGDVLQQLKGNPFAISHVKGL